MIDAVRTQELCGSAVACQRCVRTGYTDKFSEALMSQPERLRLTNQGAIGQTIRLRLSDLPTLRL